METKEILDFVDYTLLAYAGFEHFNGIIDEQERIEKGEIPMDIDNNSSFQQIKQEESKDEYPSFYESCFKNIKDNEPELFFELTRMSKETFDGLFTVMYHRLNQQPATTTNLKVEQILPEAKLAMTLMFLSSGNSREEIAKNFNVSPLVLWSIVGDTCKKFSETLGQHYLPEPSEDEWKDIGAEFTSIFGLPNCLGAIDAKRVKYVYKQHKKINRNQMLLFGVADAQFCFTCADIGKVETDKAVEKFSISSFATRILNESLLLPESSGPFLGKEKLPYYFVGAHLIPMKPYWIKKFPSNKLDSADKQKFNEIIDRLGNVTENSFGVLCARWKFISNEITSCTTKQLLTIVRGLFVLHNFLVKCEPMYLPEEYVDHRVGGVTVKGLWRKEIVPLPSSMGLGVTKCKRSAIILRNNLLEFVNRRPHRFLLNQLSDDGTRSSM